MPGDRGPSGRRRAELAGWAATLPRDFSAAQAADRRGCMGEILGRVAEDLAASEEVEVASQTDDCRGRPARPTEPVRLER